ncbi:MAG: ribosome-associated translation inhibitor RaiA [Clostridia bacterium]|nr:ribosome-associated translation inhibitor RaiA [Clostridia bacterium]
MKIEFLSKNYSPSDKLKNVIEHKLEKLDKFFDEDTKIKVMLKQSKEIYTLELTIGVEKGVLRSEVSSDNMYNNIDIALPKLEKQIIKHHKKVESKFKNFKAKDFAAEVVANAEEAEHQSIVVKSKTFELIPMTVEDAIEELELVGHDFFVFLNKTSNAVNVVYRRMDGDYGLIETVV